MNGDQASPVVPILRGKRLRLTPFCEDHLTDAYVAWLNDPAVVRYSENRHRRHDLESCRDYFRSMVEGGHYYWAIVWQPDRRDTPRHVGNVTAYADRNNRTADLAIIVGDRGLLGLGAGREAWDLALTWLLAEGRFHKVTAGTMATNLAMLKTMQATGMVEEGRRRRQYLCDGKRVDAIMVAKFAEGES